MRFKKIELHHTPLRHNVHAMPCAYTIHLQPEEFIDRV